MISYITLHSKCCAWQQVTQQSLQFQFAAAWGLHLLVQHIVANIRSLCATFKEGAASVSFWLADCTSHKQAPH